MSLGGNCTGILARFPPAGGQNTEHLGCDFSLEEIDTRSEQRYMLNF